MELAEHIGYNDGYFVEGAGGDAALNVAVALPLTEKFTLENIEIVAMWQLLYRAILIFNHSLEEEKILKIEKNNNPKDSKVYLIGSGIASLASATYLIKDAGMPGDNIHILEQDDIVGGACDGGGDTEEGFVVRGGRMHEEHYVCYWDLLSYPFI